MSLIETVYENGEPNLKKIPLVNYNIDIPIQVPGSGVAKTGIPCPGCNQDVYILPEGYMNKNALMEYKEVKRPHSPSCNRYIHTQIKKCGVGKEVVVKATRWKLFGRLGIGKKRLDIPKLSIGSQ
ncbi:MAG: hypothetical protein ABIE55_03810 [Candidatus Aenigmatarchaeota archaeon]